MKFVRLDMMVHSNRVDFRLMELGHGISSSGFDISGANARGFRCQVHVNMCCSPGPSQKNCVFALTFDSHLMGIPHWRGYHVWHLAEMHYIGILRAGDARSRVWPKCTT